MSVVISPGRSPVRTFSIPSITILRNQMRDPIAELIGGSFLLKCATALSHT